MNFRLLLLEQGVLERVLVMKEVAFGLLKKVCELFARQKMVVERRLVSQKLYTKQFSMIPSNTVRDKLLFGGQKPHESKRLNLLR